MKKVFFFILLGTAVLGCKQNSNEVTHKHTNALIHETSPYLLQHAHNPVNWEAWHPDVLEKAKKEDKLLLISIGYAACHWCHVMEKECFEDEAVAQVMNENFINIKIDREERPDVDQIYMDAIQMISGQGGWPLNIVALPDGRPFWGATYVPKDNWIKSLEQLAELYKNDKQRVTDYANDLANGLQAINLVENSKDSELYSLEQLDGAVQNWTQYFDTFLGGHKSAPKFMMPNNWDFLLHYATATNKPEIMEFVDTTLTRMAYGGIYDHVGGGFSRYAVDVKWHVPHFEKMLYDNGQLTSLYAKAYAVTKNNLYKDVVVETIAFVEEELMDKNGGFYSSLDADSLDEHGNLEEGAYYVWTKEQLIDLLGDDFKLFQEYFNINSYGHWEEENYVLIRDKSNDEIANSFDIDIKTLRKTIKKNLSQLKSERNKRSRPRLDDKILTSWNGLMLKGLVDAYRYLGNDDYLKLALKNAEFIEREMIKEDGSLYRNHKGGKSSINAFLDDYATVIDAYFSLYEVTFDEKWLNLSKNLLEHTQKHFFDDASGMFFYTSDKDRSLIRRTIEVDDNVISSSNSMMAINLYKFDKLFPEQGYGKTSKQMFKNVQKDFDRRAQGFSNWLHLVLYTHQNFYEIAIIGDDYMEMAQQIGKEYLPNSIMAGSKEDGNLELLKNRSVPGRTLTYICQEGACKLPVSTAKDALQQL
ncbi:thioredoxin domain-containing protein [Muricauda oceani]|uniref:Thioredoxin domain-containing protein n=1 Tax=Flagellimonas oceani TaxID=2698672 RepID=A0A6G7J9B9_9FLAO|nr:thioredoxin domain-containing protein [Allomuricauda oceani]MBW8242125.1 thioredoxin domain-containing protein [Allomuricauda oceani]QII47032.1 thioredoxin domain-containing protein [Allomuricauda oceani]